jgi:hypothetical protein
MMTLPKKNGPWPLIVSDHCTDWLAGNGSHCRDLLSPVALVVEVEDVRVARGVLRAGVLLLPA